MSEENVKPRRIKWISLCQLFVGFLIPVVIAIYTFVQDQNDRTIAADNRKIDLQIARDQREQDLQLADDQQKANILASYENFLVEHLNTHGMTLNTSESARYVARLKTLTTVAQLDSIRKTFLLRSLYEGKLITRKINDEEADQSAIISLERADLSFIRFGQGRWKYLSLPESNLTGANFVASDLSCVNFRLAILRHADLTDVLVRTTKFECFPNISSASRTSFAEADFYRARLTHSELFPTDFSSSKLIEVDFRSFFCTDCLFKYATITRSDLTNAVLMGNSTFESAGFTESRLDSASFQSSIFSRTRFIGTSGSNINFEFCSFDSTIFIENEFIRSSFIQSNFSNIIFNQTNFTASKFINSTFSSLTLFQCQLNDVIFIQSIFVNVHFNQTPISNKQFINCRFHNTTLPDEIMSADG